MKYRTEQAPSRGVSILVDREAAMVDIDCQRELTGADRPDEITGPMAHDFSFQQTGYFEHNIGFKIDLEKPVETKNGKTPTFSDRGDAQGMAGAFGEYQPEAI